MPAVTAIQTLHVYRLITIEVCNHTHSLAHTHTHTCTCIESKHKHSEHDWRCLALLSDSYYSALKQLHAAPFAATALIPLQPHQGALASLLNRHFSSITAGSHQPRGTEREMERDLHPRAAQPYHSHYVHTECNLIWRMWLAISDGVYVTEERRILQ